MTLTDVDWLATGFLSGTDGVDCEQRTYAHTRLRLFVNSNYCDAGFPNPARGMCIPFRRGLWQSCMSCFASLLTSQGILPDWQTPAYSSRAESWNRTVKFQKARRSTELNCELGLLPPFLSAHGRDKSSTRCVFDISTPPDSRRASQEPDRCSDGLVLGREGARRIHQCTWHFLRYGS
jgi:hypothetical protein